jgi:hypothetical protein
VQTPFSGPNVIVEEEDAWVTELVAVTVIVTGVPSWAPAGAVHVTALVNSVGSRPMAAGVVSTVGGFVGFVDVTVQA